MSGMEFGFSIDDLARRSGNSPGHEVRDTTSNSPENAMSVSARDEVQALKFQNARLKVANSRLLESNAKLLALTTTDYLTGIANHRGFQERLASQWYGLQRCHHPQSLIMLDLDEFKLFNDVFGHVEGDHVLKVVAGILCAEARETDFVARYGGEEFAVIRMETDSQGACEAAERFRAAIEGRPWPHRKVTASFGVATMTPWPHIPQELIEHADKALYASKAMGRNRVTHIYNLLGAQLEGRSPAA